MTDTLRFFVAGIPAPGGSKRAFVVNGRAVVTDDAKRNKPWRQAVTVFASNAFKGEPLAGPLLLTVVFVMPRPKSHYRTGRHAAELRPGAPVWHECKPDATKLLRSTEDALTGVLWRDDAQVQPRPFKIYGATPGAFVALGRPTQNDLREALQEMALTPRGDE